MDTAILLRGTSKLHITGPHHPDSLPCFIELAVIWFRSYNGPLVAWLKPQLRAPKVRRSVDIHFDLQTFEPDMPYGHLGMTAMTAIFSAGCGRFMIPNTATLGNVGVDGYLIPMTEVGSKDVQFMQATGMQRVVVHHANVVAMQQLIQKTGAQIQVHGASTMDEVLELIMAEEEDEGEEEEEED